MLNQDHSWNTSFKPLIIGFVLSVIFTCALFFIGQGCLIKGVSLLVWTLGLSCIAACIQLFFFLHLGLENKPHWNLITFLFTLLILVVIVLGSLWIMYNLNYNMML